MDVKLTKQGDALITSHAGWGEDGLSAMDYRHLSDDGILHIKADALTYSEGYAPLGYRAGPMSAIEAAQFITLHDAAARAYTENLSDRMDSVTGYSHGNSERNSHSGYRTPVDYTTMVHCAAVMAAEGMAIARNPDLFTPERAQKIARSILNEAGLDMQSGQNNESAMEKAGADKLLAEREGWKDYSLGADTDISFDIGAKGIRHCRIAIVNGECKRQNYAEEPFTPEALGRMLKTVLGDPAVQAKIPEEKKARAVAQAAALEGMGRMLKAEAAEGRPHIDPETHAEIRPTFSSMMVADMAKRESKGADIYRHHADAPPKLVAHSLKPHALAPMPDLPHRIADPRKALKGATVGLGRLGM